MKKTSKAEQVRAFLSRGENNPEKIADEVGTSVSYVYYIKCDLNSGRKWTRVAGEKRRKRKIRGEYIKKFRASHVDRRNEERRKNYAIGRRYIIHSRRRWTNSDIEMLLNFNGTDRQLSKIIGRSVQAIQVKRVLIKRGRR